MPYSRAYVREQFEETTVIECGRYVFTTPEGVDPEQAKQRVRRHYQERDLSVEDLEEHGYAKFKAQEFAECFARLQELGKIHEHRPVPSESLIDRDIGATDTPSEIEIPLIVAREGTAKIAAYLRASGIRRSNISHHLGVSERTVKQYLSDVRRGER